MTRTVIPAADAAALPSALSAYEAERAARIERNNAMLAALGVQQAAAAVVRGAPQAQTSAAAPHVVRHKRTASDAAPAAAAPPPVRVSKRQRLRKGLAPVEEQEPGPGQPHTPELADTDEFARLLTVDEYLERKGLPKGPLMNGHFAGWVEEGVRVQLGLAASAADAWESGGGGAFNRRCPKGESAKEFARSMLHKNPNAYFYRLNVPGEDTWHGEWSQEELDRFVEVATTYGCGDKWGLFASYIPHRVGYQCSSAYRHLLIPRGLLRDNNFRMSASGEAIWCGAVRGRGAGSGED